MLTKPAVAAAALSLALGSALAIDTALFRAAGLYDCPELCSVAGAKTSNWTRFNSNHDLNWCKNETMLISLPVYMPLDDADAHSVFYACLSSRGSEVHSRVQGIKKRSQANDGLTLRSKVNFMHSSVKSKLSNFADDTSTAIKELQARYLDVPNSDNDQTVYFAKRGSSAVGVYVGRDVQKQSIAATLIQTLQDYIASGSDLSETALFQLCGDGRNADSVAGVVAVGRDGPDSMFAVQGFVRALAEGRCVTDVDGHSKTVTMDIAYVSTNALLGSNAAAANGNSTVHPQRRFGPSSASHPDAKTMRLSRRGDCSVKQVSGGDGCAQLAGKCGLSPADFTKLHPEPNFCSTLQPGQWFCCTSGALPDMRPKKLEDGSCYPYEVVGGDTCAKIAAAHSLKPDDVEKLNQNTWGFSGCNSLWPHMFICLSPGLPPMPAPVANAKCGPQVPGTKRPPSKDTSMSDLNPCPLNACCNVWGQCGTTEEFCIESSLGPPGTSKPGKNGCISNCGMDIVNNGVGPATQITLGYFEAWNYKRGCLHMDVTQMSKSISHIHFAFIDVTAGFAVSIAPEVLNQWDKFKSMSGYHKVAAFGGWAASTEPTSYWIFREGVKPQNRDTLAENLANFVISNNMDGIDLDWEYPGAQDIPGIPAANPLDGEGYLELLKLLRQKLGNDRTISIATPASYWYLQNFPIAKASKIVDYIVYMTYDLHGQWDYGNKWSAPGCTGPSCLRSHINMTETLNSLSMITKAGVPSNKIVVGVSSYGRSFEMTQPGCTGPQCGFTGPQSTAKKGRCTDTSGYISNAEINEIISSGKAQQFTDDTESQILVYDTTNWVAYMDDENKERRKKRWAGLNFAGTTDWAVDLATFTPGDDNQQCWRTKKCTSIAVTKTEKDSTWRWDELCSDGAWDVVMEYWKKNRNSPIGFPKTVSDFFHGVSGMDCDVLASENGCRSNMMCIDGNDTGPAATFILNGFVTMSNVLLNMYDGIEDAQQTLEVNGRLDSFVKTFAPDPKEDLGIKIILDIVSFGLSAATGPFFNNFLRNTPWGKANKDTGDNVKDTVRAVISFSFTTAKDAMAPKPASDADMSAQLEIVVRHYKTALTEISKQAFSGSDESIAMLHQAIGGGKLIQASPTGKLDIEDRMSKLFYAMLIPYLWRQKEWKPVLVDTKTSCDSKVEVEIIADDDGKVCVDGKRYYLVRPEGSFSSCSGSASGEHWGMNGCHMAKAKSMDGLDKLKGGAWADLRKEDLAASIVARSKVDWKNPTDEGNWPAFDNSDHFDKMWDWISDDNMIQVPGLIDIPMCGIDEIKRNWGMTKNNYYSWPCDRP